MLMYYLWTKKFKLKAFIMDQFQNLFGKDWMESFDVWNLPINTFCNSEKAPSASAENLKREVKFSRHFFWGLGMCSKAEATFKLKYNAQPIFKPERQVPFSAWKIIEKELGCLEKIGVLGKTNYSWCKKKWTKFGFVQITL